MSEDDTGYGENEDSDDPDVWIENVSGHNKEIENFFQAAFVLSTNDVHPLLSKEGFEGN